MANDGILKTYNTCILSVKWTVAIFIIGLCAFLHVQSFALKVIYYRLYILGASDVFIIILLALVAYALHNNFRPMIIATIGLIIIHFVYDLLVCVYYIVKVSKCEGIPTFYGPPPSIEISISYGQTTITPKCKTVADLPLIMFFTVTGLSFISRFVFICGIAPMIFFGQGRTQTTSEQPSHPPSSNNPTVNAPKISATPASTTSATSKAATPAVNTSKFTTSKASISSKDVTQDVAIP